MHVTNFPPRPVTDGGTHREEALGKLLASWGARRIVVQDSVFRRNKVAKLFRLGRLMREVRSAKPGLVVCNYPAYPFFWQHKITRYTLISLLFASKLRSMANRLGFRIVIDVMDLPVFQYRDLGYQLEMSEDTHKLFDRFVFRRADKLWVCSEMLAETIRREYGCHEQSTIVALNGHSMDISPPPLDMSGPMKLAYAGWLSPWRGVACMIDAFLASGVTEAQLHMCGPSGEWISEHYADSRIIYHGSLTDAEAIRRLAGCQVGIIPYPEEGYYNLAFATKFPFYLALGMAVLSSEARETASHVRRLGVGLVAPLDKFSDAIAYLDGHRDEVAQWHRRALEVRSDFDWSNIYSRALEQTLNG